MLIAVLIAHNNNNNYMKLTCSYLGPADLKPHMKLSFILKDGLVLHCTWQRQDSVNIQGLIEYVYWFLIHFTVTSSYINVYMPVWVFMAFTSDLGVTRKEYRPRFLQ